jgi:hypothetical protein
MTSGAILKWGVMFQLLSDRLRDPARPAQEPFDPRTPGARELKDQLRHLQRLLLDKERQNEARWQMIRFESFIRDWDTVAAVMPDFVAELRSRIMRDEQRSGYIGARSELTMAAALVEKGIRPARGPTPGPDFVVTCPEGTVVIECTAAHLGVPREDNFAKIEAAIRGKGERNYCGPTALVYVDYTAIAFRGGDSLDPAFPARTKQLVENTRWGAALLGAFMMDSAGLGYRNALLRFDGREQAPILRAFLDEVFPHGKVYLPLVSIPPTS